MAMNIIEIGCSVEGNFDGIGKYARVICEEFNRRIGIDAILISGNTVGFSKIRKIVSNEMFKAFRMAEQIISTRHIDLVVVEYPFSEYNPIIILAYKKLKNVCKTNGCKLALSIHEYDRVNILRRMVVRYFATNADFVYVTESHYITSLKHLNHNIFLRMLPNFMPLFDKKKDLSKKRSFVYFGLINKSKAFFEMINAWDEFNINSEYNLSIVTASDIDFVEHEHKNILIYRDLNDEDVADILWSSTFSIVPIKPEIGFNNSTFVSTIQCGCIPIGKFSDDLKQKKFIINLLSYDICEIKKTFENAISLSDFQVMEKSNEALKFGKQFTVENTVDMMLDAAKSEEVFQ